jgi:putative transposase
MARRRRIVPGGFVYHVCNRGSRKGVLLETYEDYAAFCALLVEARRKYGVRIIAYCLLSNHFHFLLWPVSDNLPRFMKWLTGTQARRFHLARGTVGCGAVYQSRYVSRMVQEDRKFVGALKYVEGNARRHEIVERAEAWPWSSAWNQDGLGPAVPLDESPIPRPTNWLDFINDF